MLAMATLFYFAFNQLKRILPSSAQKREKFVFTQIYAFIHKQDNFSKTKNTLLNAVVIK